MFGLLGGDELQATAVLRVRPALDVTGPLQAIGQDRRRGRSDTGAAALVGQLAILAGAAGTAVVIVVWTRGLLPYAAATAWAFAGIVAGTLGAGQPILAGVAAVGIAAVAATTVLTRRFRRS